MNGAKNTENSRVESKDAEASQSKSRPACLDLPPKRRGDTGPAPDRMIMTARTGDDIEPLIVSVRSNLYDAKRGALARVSLSLPVDVDQSVANYCKDLHSQFSPLPVLNPGDSLTLGTQIDDQCTRVLEAVATHFLTLSLRGIFDFVKDDLNLTVRDGVLRFVIERVGVLLADGAPISMVKVAPSPVPSQSEVWRGCCQKRKSYCEWEKESKATKRGNVGLGEYLDDTLDGIIGEIVGYFRVVMSNGKKYRENSFTFVTDGPTVLDGNLTNPVSSVSPLEKVQKGAIDVMWPLLHGVKIGETSIMSAKDLVLFPRDIRRQELVVRTLPAKKPKVSFGDEQHLGESAVLRGYRTDSTATELGVLHGHEQPDLHDTQRASRRLQSAFSSEENVNLPLRDSPEPKLQVLRAPFSPEQKATAHDSGRVGFKTPEEHRKHGRCRTPSLLVRASPLHHVSFQLPTGRRKHAQREKPRLTSPYVPLKPAWNLLSKSPTSDAIPKIPKRPLFGRTVASILSSTVPRYSTYGDEALEHPRLMTAVVGDQLSNSHYRTRKVLQESQAPRSPIPECLRAGLRIINPEPAEKTGTSRVRTLLEHLPSLETEWIFSDGESVSENHISSGAASSSTRISAICDPWGHVRRIFG